MSYNTLRWNVAISKNVLLRFCKNILPLDVAFFVEFVELLEMRVNSLLILNIIDFESRSAS
jgi:hypothetical protein